MSIDLSRSIHPDLLEEYQQQLAEAPTTPSPRKGRKGRGAAGEPANLPPEGTVQPPADAAENSEDQSTSSESSPASADGVPSLEWLDQVRNASDPKEMFSLLTRNLPLEDLVKDDRLQGYVGNRIDRGVRDRLADLEKQRADKVRQEAFDKGDLITLGQLDAANLEQQRAQQRAQQDYENNPYMLGVRQFQASLPEEVQRAVQGRQYPDFPAYLRAVQEAAITHGVQDEISRRTSGLQKAALSQTVGSEQSPELDGGPAQAYREITDAQVAAMDLEEYGRYFDDKGRPKPGVRVRLERGIDLRHR